MAEPAAESSDHGAWAYGAGKRRAEQALRAAGLEPIALRLPTVQGEGDASLRLWAYLERMLDGAPLLLPDGGQRPVRFFYAGDLALALERLGAAATLAHQAYNLASPDVLPLRAFLDHVAALARLEPCFIDVTWEDYRAAGLDPGFLPYASHWASVLDPARVGAELGIVCSRSEDYLPPVVRWHLEHRPQTSHEGYVQRAGERVLAARLLESARGAASHPAHRAD
jgi:nucleoside-diphosphate-sugar epimerase